jgi:hypothetical protein
MAWMALPKTEGRVQRKLNVMKGSAIIWMYVKAWRGKQIQAWTHEYFMYGNTLKCSWFFIKQDYGNGEPINKPRDHLKQTLSSFICEDHES